MQQFREKIYSSLERDGKTCLVRTDWRDELVSVLFGDTSGSAHSTSGRGTVFRFPFSGGEGILRRYHRGGFASHFSRDAYFNDNRALRELEVLDRLNANGFPAPEPLGAVWERRGAMVRGALATRFIEAENMEHAVKTEREFPVSSLHRVGQVIRAMHDAGVYHADLNARNVLVNNDGVFLIDFDNAHVKSVVPPLARARNLLRLRRSIEKLGLPMAAFDAIRDGYGDISMPGWLDSLYKWKGALSDLASGRLRSHAP